MPERMRARRAACAGAATLLLLAAGCSHLRWPWHKAPPPPPPPVHELDVSGAGSANYPQSWKRNTLLLDLTAASGSGRIAVKPVEGSSWPVRLAVRVTPGAFAVLSVQGDERVSLPISATGAAPIDLELPPGIYGAKTAQLEVSWGPAAAPLQ
jgi:hypothetical protein